MSNPAASRGHKQSYLRELLAERDLAPRSSLGQCFLIDLNILDLLLEQAQLSDRDFVLEVGAGTGSLTQRLAERAGQVLSVEIDPGLYRLAREAVADRANVTLVHADILKTKNALNPLVLDEIARLAGAESSFDRKLVANLPYVVATPVLSLLLLQPGWKRFVVTIQKELADRLVARPSTKDYGALSVLVQALAEVELVRELPPTVFWPRPKVSSAIILIQPQSEKAARIEDVGRFHQLIRGVMLHRRKNLRGALHAMLPSVPKPSLDAFLAGLSIDSTVRAESLTVEDFIRMGNSLAHSSFEIAP